MALALLEESLESWRATLDKDESPDHKIKKQLLNHLSDELTNKGSLYAALVFHVTLHRLQWQCSVENKPPSVDDYALAVAPQPCDNIEMWKRSINNELWNIHESLPEISSALVNGWSSRSDRKSLLQLLTPPDCRKDIDIERSKDLKRGSKTMMQIDDQVGKFLDEQSPFPKLWTWFTKKPVKPETLSMILSSNRGGVITREVQIDMGAVDRKKLESSCLRLVSEIWNDILKRENPPGASNRIDEIDPNVNKDPDNISNTISGPNARKGNNSDTISGPKKSDNNPRNDTISVVDSLEKLKARVGNIETPYTDYEKTIQFLGPRGSVPEWLQKIESTIEGVVSQYTKFVERERIVTSTRLVRDMANRLIIGGLSSLDEGSDNEFSKPARMMITILAEILFYNRNGDGDRICSCIIILLSETTSWEALTTFAQSQDSSQEYTKGIRELAKTNLPLSGLVGFSIWKILQKNLPDSQESCREKLYKGIVTDKNLLKFLMSSKRRRDSSPESSPTAKPPSKGRTKGRKNPPRIPKPGKRQNDPDTDMRDPGPFDDWEFDPELRGVRELPEPEPPKPEPPKPEPEPEPRRSKRGKTK